MKEHHLPVRRTARFHTLGLPDAGEVWIVCHGYAQLARYFLRAFAAIDDGSRYIVAPEALNRYYYETSPGVHAGDARIAATWMTREDRANEIDDYIAYLDTLAGHVVGNSTTRVIALGFSQGAQTVSRWAVRGATRMNQVILCGAGPAADLEPAPDMFRGARATFAVGDADEYLTGAEAARQHARLTAAGVPCELLRYQGGHRIEADLLRQLTMT